MNALSTAPVQLVQALHQVIPDTQLTCQQLPETPIRLWLIPPDLPTERMDDEVVRRIWNDTPYWIFCWASGLAMAQWILTDERGHHGRSSISQELRPEEHCSASRRELNSRLDVKDKVVLDFGAGSGVVAIAAKMAGAKRVIACDIDQVSLLACKENARLNQVELEYLDDLYACTEQVDILLAADVLYDQSNRFFLDEFLKFAKEVWVADSRVKNFTHPKYRKVAERSATTWPDLDEAKEFRNVSFYTTASA